MILLYDSEMNAILNYQNKMLWLLLTAWLQYVGGMPGMNCHLITKVCYVIHYSILLHFHVVLMRLYMMLFEFSSLT